MAKLRSPALQLLSLRVTGFVPREPEGAQAKKSKYGQLEARMGERQATGRVPRRDAPHTSGRICSRMDCDTRALDGEGGGERLGRNRQRAAALQ
jgi:hypothetical protein